MPQDSGSAQTIQDQIVNTASVRAWFDYDPDTGILTWKMSRGKVKAGDEAGYTMPIGYRAVRLYGRLYYVHRIVWLWMTGEWPVGQVDHGDRVKANNRWLNLADVTHQQNAMNTPAAKPERRRNGRWSARVRIGTVRHNLGTYDTEEEAQAVILKRRAEG
jgi:hypothetical protein